MKRQRIEIGLIFGFAVVLLAGLSSPSLAKICTVPPSGLVSWWPGEGNANDIQDGNNGTLIKDGQLSRNPVSSVKFFPEAHRTRYFSNEELRRLHGLIDGENWKLVAFALETGLRKSEQFQLRWEHISFEARTLTIPLPKGGRTRHVPLSQEALIILRSFDSFLSSPWVFPGLKTTLQPMDSRAFLRRAFEPALKKAGIQDASWHTLRHTTASRLVMAGVPLPTVKEILGHRDLQTTLRYAHLSPGHIQAAIEKGSLVHLEIGTVTKTVTNDKAEKAEAL